MAQIVLIMGKSGSGKTTSLRNFNNGELGIISVVKKPLPFKTDLQPYYSDDYANIKGALKAGKAKSIVVDDANFLMTNQFMRGHSSAGKGNGVFALYNQIGDDFWNLVMFATALPDDKIIYFIMHEEKNDIGDIKPKSIGKMLDEKVCIEGLFTIVLHAMVSDKKHVFRTQSDGLDVSKSPIDMFDEEIPNDLKLVDDAIRKYYKIEQKNKEQRVENK